MNNVSVRLESQLQPEDLCFSFIVLSVLAKATGYTMISNSGSSPSTSGPSTKQQQSAVAAAVAAAAAVAVSLSRSFSGTIPPLLDPPMMKSKPFRLDNSSALS